MTGLFCFMYIEIVKLILTQEQEKIGQILAF